MLTSPAQLHACAQKIVVPNYQLNQHAGSCVHILREQVEQLKAAKIAKKVANRMLLAKALEDAKAKQKLLTSAIRAEDTAGGRHMRKLESLVRML